MEWKAKLNCYFQFRGHKHNSRRSFSLIRTLPSRFSVHLPNNSQFIQIYCVNFISTSKFGCSLPCLEKTFLVAFIASNEVASRINLGDKLNGEQICQQLESFVGFIAMGIESCWSYTARRDKKFDSPWEITTSCKVQVSNALTWNLRGTYETLKHRHFYSWS